MNRALAIALVLAACGPKPTPARPCIESVEARAAEGDYRANGGGGYDAHGGRCYQSCQAGDEAACVEYRLLSNEQYNFHYLTLESYALSEQDCADGHANACRWLEDPDVVEAIERERYERTPYQGSWGSGQSPVDGAVATISGNAAMKGLTLLEQSTYSMVGTSDISFAVDSSAGDGRYVIAVVAERAMTFTAVAGSTSLPEVYVADDVFVRMGEVSLTQDGATTLSIHADGSERGDLKFLLFANTGD